MKCFTTAKANAFENLLEPLQKLLRLSPPIALSLAHPDLFGRILQKLRSSKAVVRLNLLRIVCSICDASEEQGGLIIRYGLLETVQRLAEIDGAVLVRNMASELLRSSEINEKIGMSGSKRRPVRRSSASTTPPGLLSSHSMPPTPTGSRSTHSTNLFSERNIRQANVIKGPLSYRTNQDGVNSAGSLTSSHTPGAGAKSRLPRTTSSRQSNLISAKEENAIRSSMHDNSPMPTPNSRRRRRISNELR